MEWANGSCDEGRGAFKCKAAHSGASTPFKLNTALGGDKAFSVVLSFANLPEMNGIDSGRNNPHFNQGHDSVASEWSIKTIEQLWSYWWEAKLWRGLFGFRGTGLVWPRWWLMFHMRWGMILRLGSYLYINSLCHSQDHVTIDQLAIGAVLPSIHTSNYNAKYESTSRSCTLAPVCSEHGFNYR